jgi:hypothetical protein
MKETEIINVQLLEREAGNSEHKESYRTLERSRNYRIGVGTRLATSVQPSFFLEVLVYLCPKPPRVDTSLFEKDLTFLKELQARGYSLTCQNDSCISCETTVAKKDLATEYRTIKLITKRIFRKT